MQSPQSRVPSRIEKSRTRDTHLRAENFRPTRVAAGQACRASAESKAGGTEGKDYLSPSL